MNIKFNDKINSDDCDDLYGERLDEYISEDIPKCESCGAPLKEHYEEGEAWGSRFIHKYYECPNCD